MPKVLVIEDEEMLREEVIDWLMMEGYETLSAGNGLEGIKFANQDHPDLVLCDVMMPGMTGFEVIRELRSRPNTAAIPLIFLTARATEQDLEAGAKAGADGYITKPFARVELLEAVSSMLQGHV